MIVQIIEFYHDYGQKTYFIDSDKLDKSNPIDAGILEKIGEAPHSSKVHFFIEPEDQIQNPFWECPHLTDEAILADDGFTARPDKTVVLRIQFNC